ncbi:mediator of RNA polymerase II transcription subunit 6 isoform X2 [Eurytemora carolleeae]|uniref:mediator of RNA polymerase II transcription subunit 6 isoform X2 n=1 Tax=Eurytemora carolleeae TaxID=1294199 RepID=UPI000C791E2C|nr:mediator of RNA polymerase II transcription subunit 6 isoform X2 [Eurytemora carolleeae]|eukprot:XP_023325913.1 mediator of RNA polymerase II transcription subunit 6-like isoform X2 [Eurytemora affinis]
MANYNFQMNMGDESKVEESLLSISWHDSAWIPILNQANVMDYFSERSNPFYDRTCNNEVLKMQKLGVADVQLQNMQGTEFQLLHVQEPILYVIRKQTRHSPTQVTPLSDYYIIAGVVYQAPDLSTLLNSRIVSAVSHLQGAFEEARGYSRYHPSRGYWWDFGKDKEKKAAKVQKKKKEEPSSLFQRRRVDMLLDHLTRQFPFRTPAALEGKMEEVEGEGEKDAEVEDQEEENSVKTEGVKREREKDGIKSENKRLKLER